VNPDTGAIAVFETDEDAEKAGFTVKLTAGQFKKFAGMNRKQRRAEAARLRRDATKKAGAR
jgi:hypothetical protein